MILCFISEGISCLSFPISVIQTFHNIVHISAHWPLHSSFNIHACNSCLFSLCNHGRTQRFKRGHIKEMLMTATYSFAWVWNEGLREKHIFARVCVLEEKHASSWKLFCISDAMQSSELRLFTFDFHFKDFFITRMVIKLITFSDFDLYSYVLIATMIRWLRDGVAWYLTELITLTKILPETLIASMIYGPVPEQCGKRKFQCCNSLSNFYIAILYCHISMYLQQCLDCPFLAQHMQQCFGNLIFMSLQSPRTLSPTPSAEVSLVEHLGAVSYCD